MNEKMEYLQAGLALNKYTVTGFTDAYLKDLVKEAEASQDKKVISETADFLHQLAMAVGGEASIYLASAEYYLKPSEEAVLLLLDKAWEYRDLLGTDRVSFIFQQSLVIPFLNPAVDTTSVFAGKVRLYDWLLDQYSILLSDLLVPIPENERNRDVVIVITEQFLQYTHGPSKSAADRWVILKNHCHKQVLLINSAELLSPVGRLPFYDPKGGNYEAGNSDKDHIEWKGVTIPFIQCANNMPNPCTIIEFLQLIRDLKPEFVVAIGGEGILSGLASKLVPAICVGMCFSTLQITGCSFQTYSGLLNDTYRENLKSLGWREEQVITATFGFSLMEQTENHSRSELGIGEDVFLAVAVGARLDNEITAEFWEMFRNAAKLCDNLEILIVGDYSMPEYVEQEIRRRIHVLGLVSDAISYIELCDLYLNPLRTGGGTSVVEAMSKGLPAITVAYGDVAANVGEEFCVEGYEEYPELIRRYCTDKEFYSQMATKVLKRSDRLLNAEGEFVRIIEEFNKRKKTLFPY